MQRDASHLRILLQKICTVLFFTSVFKTVIKNRGGFRFHSIRRKKVKQNPGKVDNLNI